MKLTKSEYGGIPSTPKAGQKQEYQHKSTQHSSNNRSSCLESRKKIGKKNSSCLCMYDHHGLWSPANIHVIIISFKYKTEFYFK